MCQFEISLTRTIYSVYRVFVLKAAYAKCVCGHGSSFVQVQPG